MSRPTIPAPNAGALPPNGSVTSPPRSSTAPHKSHRPHLPHHVHRTHHHHHRHDKSVPQSAIQPSSSNPFGDFLTKTASRTLPESGITGGAIGAAATAIVSSPLNPAHHTSTANLTSAATAPTLTNTTEDPPSSSALTSAQALKDDSPSIPLPAAHLEAQKQKQKWARVHQLRATRTALEADLHKTLSALSTVSSTTTRRLDYTYYALQTSLSTLRAGIGTLHELSRSTHAQAARFDGSAVETTQETTAVVDAAEAQFERQAERIGELEDRLRRGRERAVEFSERMDKVRLVVEECRVRELQGKRRRRGWWTGCLGGIAAVVIGLVALSISRGVYHTDDTENMTTMVMDPETQEDLKVQGFWDKEMENGTVGADGLKGGLEELREATGGWHGLQDGGVDGEVEDFCSRLEEKQEEEAQGGRSGGSRRKERKSMDAEATLGLLDEL